MINREMRRSRAYREGLADENMKWGPALQLIERREWPASCHTMRTPPGEVWRSSGFLLQVYYERDGIERLTVCRAAVDVSGNWRSEITWDELQRLKRECGRGDRYAVELFPADADVVNVSNMRHLWVLLEPPPFAWRDSKTISASTDV